MSTARENTSNENVISNIPGAPAGTTATPNGDGSFTVNIPGYGDSVWEPVNPPTGNFDPNDYFEYDGQWYSPRN